MMRIFSKLKAPLKNKKGLTMVNVLVGFVLLLVIILSFTATVNLSLRLYRKSEDIRKSCEENYSLFYVSTEYSKLTGDIPSSAASYTFSAEGGGGFTVNSHIGEYDSVDRKIYFFGERKSVS